MHIIMTTATSETIAKAALFKIPKRIIYFIQQDSFYIYHLYKTRTKREEQNHALTFISL